MLYRNRNLNIEQDFLEKFKAKIHAPVEKYFCDTCVHRVYGVDVVDDTDLENFTDCEIEAAVISCMKEDMVAVSIRKES